MGTALALLIIFLVGALIWSRQVKNSGFIENLIFAFGIGCSFLMVLYLLIIYPLSVLL
jgi:hypothetical protein